MVHIQFKDNIQCYSKLIKHFTNINHKIYFLNHFLTVSNKVEGHLMTSFCLFHLSIWKEILW